MNVDTQLKRILWITVPLIALDIWQGQWFGCLILSFLLALCILSTPVRKL